MHRSCLSANTPTHAPTHAETPAVHGKISVTKSDNGEAQLTCSGGFEVELAQEKRVSPSCLRRGGAWLGVRQVQAGARRCKQVQAGASRRWFRGRSERGSIGNEYTQATGCTPREPTAVLGVAWCAWDDERIPCLYAEASVDLSTAYAVVCSRKCSSTSRNKARPSLSKARTGSAIRAARSPYGLSTSTQAGLVSAGARMASSACSMH